MSRSSRALVPWVVSLALVFAGSAGAAASVRAAKTAPVNTWATSVCTSIGRWERQLSTLDAAHAAASTATPGNASSAKTLLTAVLDRAAKATDRLTRQLKAAGSPSIKDGAAISGGFRDAITGVRVALIQARTGTATLPVADAGAFVTAAQALTVQLQTAATTLSTNLAQLLAQHPGSLDQALASSKACRAIA